MEKIELSTNIDFETGGKNLKCLSLPPNTNIADRYFFDPNFSNDIYLIIVAYGHIVYRKNILNKNSIHIFESIESLFSGEEGASILVIKTIKTIPSLPPSVGYA